MGKKKISSSKQKERREDNKEEKKEKIDEEFNRRYITFEFEVSGQAIEAGDEGAQDAYAEQQINNIENKLHDVHFHLETHLTPDAYEMVTSSGEEFKDPSIYIGTSGNLYYYYTKLKFFEKKQNQEEVKEALESFNIAFEINLELWKNQTMDKKNISSFFMGIPGVMTMGYLIFHKYNEATKAEQCLTKILDYTELPVTEGELLYGSTGLLYCLLMVKDYNPDCTRVDKPMMNLVLDIIGKVST